MAREYLSGISSWNRYLIPNRVFSEPLGSKAYNDEIVEATQSCVPVVPENLIVGRDPGFLDQVWLVEC
jgi:hypothetical protein